MQNKVSINVLITVWPCHGTWNIMPKSFCSGKVAYSPRLGEKIPNRVLITSFLRALGDGNGGFMALLKQLLFYFSHSFGLLCALYWIQPRTLLFGIRSCYWKTHICAFNEIRQGGLHIKFSLTFTIPLFCPFLTEAPISIFSSTRNTGLGPHRPYVVTSQKDRRSLKTSKTIVYQGWFHFTMKSLFKTGSESITDHKKWLS